MRGGLTRGSTNSWIFGLLAVAMVLAAWVYGTTYDAVAWPHDLLIPFSFLALGILIKYGDQAYDEDAFSKRNTLLLAIPGGIWAGLLIMSDGDSATIFIGLLIALLLAAKYDNPAFRLGFVLAGGMAALAIILNLTSPHLLGVVIIAVVAFVDEKVNDMTWVEEGTTFSSRLLRQRPFLKVAVLALCALGMLSSFLYFFAFLAFDFGYSWVESISIPKAGAVLG